MLGWQLSSQSGQRKGIFMSYQMEKLIANKIESRLSRRRGALGLLGLGLLMPLAACGQGGKKMRDYAVLDVEMFSYVDRVIVDIIFDGTDLGVMNKYGGTGLITGVRIPFGVQTLTYTLGGPAGVIRENKKIKNALVVSPEQIPTDAQYVGLHLYPDNTAEVTFSESMPERTIRGRKIMADRK
jgi:hypothetical protein